MAQKPKYPPLIQQFIDNQKSYPDAIVATEVGGFFEIWEVHDGDEKIGHAIRVADLLDTVLTRRNKSKVDSPYMIGFPNHAADGYFKKLVDLGETVIVVEQNIRGRKADGNKNITREVAKILSPGTVIDQLNSANNNFFASIYEEGNNVVGICLIDISTGEIKISEMSKEQTQDYFDKIKPREILITGEIKLNFHEKQLIHYNSDSNTIKKLSSCGKIISEVYEIPNPTSNPTYSITSLGLEFWRTGVIALGNILNYLSSTEYNSKLLKKLNKPEIFSIDKHLTIPLNGFLSLEIITSTSHKDDQNSLLGSLDRCKTSMGRRLLKNWLMSPSSDSSIINKRHDLVDKYIKQNSYFEELRDVYDISRLSRRMLLGMLKPHEMVDLFNSLGIIQSILKGEGVKSYKKVDEILKYIEQNIDVGIAKTYNESQEYNFFKGDLKKTIDEIDQQWKKTELELLTLKEQLENILNCNKLRMIEKSESFYLLGPKGCQQKAKDNKIDVNLNENNIQIIDPKWTKLSLECFGLKQKFLQQAELEWKNLQINFIKKYGSDILLIADNISEIDVLSNFAKLSQERGYHRPKIIDNNKSVVNFNNLRHPVVEQSIKLMESFVSNNVSLGTEKNTLVIYGANSAGKSTILKSVALNIIMCQIGCFIAADKNSEMTIFDSILTRMTSFDSLGDGLSTFTMEMMELQLALQYSDKKSIFLFDEIGRGTSVEDGEAIAYATLEYLDNEKNKSITLFATHYHSLFEYIKDKKNILVQNVHCYADHLGRLVFSRKLENGPGNGSYGIEVAKSCGVPVELIRIATKYNQMHAPLKKSRYNANVEGTICPICEKNTVQQTHHIHEQKQGQVKDFIIDGAKRNINHHSNLLMICATCHEKITRGEIIVTKRKILGTNEEISIEVSHVKN